MPAFSQPPITWVIILRRVLAFGQSSIGGTAKMPRDPSKRLDLSTQIEAEQEMLGTWLRAWGETDIYPTHEQSRYFVSWFNTGVPLFNGTLLREAQSPRANLHTKYHKAGIVVLEPELGFRSTFLLH